MSPGAQGGHGAWELGPDCITEGMGSVGEGYPSPVLRGGVPVGPTPGSQVGKGAVGIGLCWIKGPQSPQHGEVTLTVGLERAQQADGQAAAGPNIQHTGGRAQLHQGGEAPQHGHGHSRWFFMEEEQCFFQGILQATNTSEGTPSPPQYPLPSAPGAPSPVPELEHPRPGLGGTCTAWPAASRGLAVAGSLQRRVLQLHSRTDHPHPPAQTCTRGLGSGSCPAA